MKLRKGFVSNSSSSSFLIYGAWIDNDEAREKLLSDEEKKELAEIEETEPYELGEFLYDKEMCVHTEMEYDERSAFGKSWAKIGDDETGREFKASVEKRLKEMFGRDIECHTIRYDYRC